MGALKKIVGKEENNGYQHFLLLPQCFLKLSFLGLLSVGYLVKGNSNFETILKICN